MCKVASRSKLTVAVLEVSANARLVLASIACRRVNNLRASVAVKISILHHHSIIRISIWELLLLLLLIKLVVLR